MYAANGRQSTAQLNGIWADGAVITNPTANAVLETTGSLVGGDYFVTFLMYCDVATSFAIAWRNAADSADQHVQNIPIPAATLIELVFPTKVSPVQNERFSVRANASVIGNAQASILYSKISG